MQIPFFPARPRAAHATQANRTDARTALIVALHAAAFVLFFYKPIVGAAALVVALGLAVGITRPLPVAVMVIGLLWINDPLADYFPMKQYTAWKDVLILLIAFGWMLRNVVLYRPMVLDTPLSRPLLLVIALFFALCALSPTPIHAILGLKATVFYMVWFFVLPDIVRNKRDAATLIWALMFGTFVLGAYDLWKVQQPVGSFPPTRSGRLYTGYMATHWSGSVNLIPLGVILGIATAGHFRGWQKWLMYAAVFSGMLGLLAAGSRAHWLTMGTAIIIMSVIRRRYWVIGAMVVLALAGGFFVQRTADVDVGERALSAADSKDYSAKSRENETREVTIPFVLTHPLGVGTGSMTAAGSAKVWASGPVKLALASGIIHNGFALVAIEIGWLGLGAWLWFLFEALRTSYGLSRQLRTPYVRDLGLGLFGMTLWFTAMHFATPMITAPLLSVVVWIAFGLIALLPRLDQLAEEARAAEEREDGVQEAGYEPVPLGA